MKAQHNTITDKRSIRENLLTIISHDVYSPLRFSTMIGKTIVLQQHEIDKEEILAALEDINITNARILLLLSNILKTIEFENKDYLPYFFDEHLYTLVQDKMDFFRLMAKNKNIELNNNISSSIILKTDKTILGIIIQNLLSNAIKFTNKGGTVKISTVVKKSKLTILVADNGKGMPTKSVTAIEQQKPITILPDTDNLKGNGLGWLLMHDLIKLLKGTFKITSKVNKGTTVSLQLPIL